VSLHEPLEMDAIFIKTSQYDLLGNVARGHVHNTAWDTDAGARPIAGLPPPRRRHYTFSRSAGEAKHHRTTPARRGLNRRPRAKVPGHHVRADGVHIDGDPAHRATAMTTQ
jgi:hypothetical protein